MHRRYKTQEADPDNYSLLEVASIAALYGAEDMLYKMRRLQARTNNLASRAGEIATNKLTLRLFSQKPCFRASLRLPGLVTNVCRDFDEIKVSVGILGSVHYYDVSQPHPQQLNVAHFAESEDDMQPPRPMNPLTMLALATLATQTNKQ